LWIFVWAIVGLGALQAVMMVGRRLISGRQALGVEMDLRNGLYAHLVRLSFGFYDRNQTGQLMSRATVDLQGVRFFLGNGLIFFFQNVLTVVSVSIVLFFFEWRLALVVLAMTPFLVVVAYRYSHVAHPTPRDVHRSLAAVGTVAKETSSASTSSRRSPRSRPRRRSSAAGTRRSSPIPSAPTGSARRTCRSSR